MKEFKLPPTWWVKVTEENKAVLSEWRETPVGPGELIGMSKWKSGEIRKGHNPVRSTKTDSYDFGDEITYEQFKMYVLKEFPEKWCIRQDASQKVCDWFNNKNYTSSAGLDGSWKYLLFPKWKGNSYFNRIPEGYTEITLEQFKQHVLKQPIMEKKIIGYRAPFDLYVGEIRAGDLLVPYPPNRKHVDRQYVKQNYNSSGFHTLPGEIVESWEPVYEDEKITIAGYDMRVENGVAKFGSCQSFSKTTVEELICLAKATNFSLTISSDKVTLETLEKILKILQYN